jgi:hypothetical protein
VSGDDDAKPPRADQRQGKDGGRKETRCCSWPVEAHGLWSLAVMGVTSLRLP